MKITMNQNENSVPDGEYDLLISSAADRVSQNGNDMIELSLKILGVNNPFTLKEYIVDGAYAVEKARRVLNSCGVYPDNGATVTNPDFVGRKARAVLKNEKDENGVNRIRIKRWIPRPSVSKSANPEDDVPF